MSIKNDIERKAERRRELVHGTPRPNGCVSFISPMHLLCGAPRTANTKTHRAMGLVTCPACRAAHFERLQRLAS